MLTYTPSSDRIMHNTVADFSKRSILKPIHIVQYDTGLPILAVSLYSDGNEYTIPVNAEINIRLGKKDRTFVYNPALGCDSERHIVYFEITQQMTAIRGRCTPIIELKVNNDIAGSSAIEFEIDRNPIQEEDIESSTEFIAIQEDVERAEEAAVNAEESANDAASSKTSAAGSASAASTSAKQASDSATNAATSEENASVSKDAAGRSALAAAQSMARAETAADNSEASALNAAESKNLAAESAEASAGSASEASVSETNAASSAGQAEQSATSAADHDSHASSAATFAEQAADCAALSAQEAANTDVGLLEESLSSNKVYQNINDSSEETLLDSSGNIIESVVIFTGAYETQLLRNRISVLEDLIMNIFRTISPGKVYNMLSRIIRLEEHAILDSGYGIETVSDEI